VTKSPERPLKSGLGAQRQIDLVTQPTTALQRPVPPNCKRPKIKHSPPRHHPTRSFHHRPATSNQLQPASPLGPTPQMAHSAHHAHKPTRITDYPRLFSEFREPLLPVKYSVHGAASPVHTSTSSLSHVSPAPPPTLPVELRPCVTPAAWKCASEHPHEASPATRGGAREGREPASPGWRSVERMVDLQI